MISKRLKKKVIRRSIFYANCRHCNKYIESQYVGQLVWNLDVHEDNCKQNKEKDEETKNE